MLRGPCDEIGIIEAMYDVSLERRAWLEGVSRALASNLNADLGGLISLHSGLVPCAEPMLVDAPAELAEGLRFALEPFARQDPTVTRSIPSGSGGLSGLVETFSEQHVYRRSIAPYLHRVGARDTSAFFVNLAPSSLAVFSCVHSKESTPSRLAKRRYSALSKHFRAAWGIRHRLGAPASDGTPVERAQAVFAPSGACQHATGLCRDSIALAALSAAVRARECARTRGLREEPERALTLWPALVAGRWALADHVELDGRRVVLAVAGEAVLENPRALSPKEQRVALLVASGATNCEIAAELNLTEGGVAAHLHSAMRKFKCSSRGDLIRIAHSDNETWTLADGPESLAVLAERPRRCTVSEFPALTASERAVLAMIRSGNSNKQIASTRKRSERTVANQVASILRKAGRHSRFELLR